MNTVTDKNVLAVGEYSKATRILVRKLEVLISNQDNVINTLTGRLSFLEQQVHLLLVKLNNGGPTA